MLTKKIIETPQGPAVTWEFDGSDGMEGVIVTGPVTGVVTVSDGTQYDVSPEYIEHKPGHAEEICNLIKELRH
jgi:hypothetical protein